MIKKSKAQLRRERKKRLAVKAAKKESGYVTKLVTLDPESVASYVFVKEKTHFPDDKLWKVMLTQFAKTLGMNSERCNEILYRAIVAESESEQSIIRAQIDHMRQLAAKQPQGKGRRVKLPSMATT